jgi:hypothetical protein
LCIRVAQAEREVIAAVWIPAADVVFTLGGASVALFALVALGAEPESYSVGADDFATGIERQASFLFADDYCGSCQGKD